MDPLQLAKQKAQNKVAFHMGLTGTFAICFAASVCFHYSFTALEEDDQSFNTSEVSEQCQKVVTKWKELSDNMKPFPFPVMLVATVTLAKKFMISLSLFFAITSNDLLGCDRLMKRLDKVEETYDIFFSIYAAITLWGPGDGVGFVNRALVYSKIVEMLVNNFWKRDVDHFIQELRLKPDRALQ